MNKRRQTIKKFAVAVIASVVAFSVSAATVYVSSSGSYTDETGVTHTAYTDLQAAVTAAGTGGTVWIENGFVCDSGNDGNGSRVTLQNVTLRSRSGDWETGAEIRGAWHSEEAPCGENSLRCANLGKGVTLIGLRLVGGATITTGGGVACLGKTSGGAILQNCLIADCCSMGNGGGVYSATMPHLGKIVLTDCMITNCFAGGDGGGAWFNVGGSGTDRGGYVTNTVVVCNIASNSTSKSGGGLFNCVAVNSLIANNRACGDESERGRLGGSGGGTYNTILTGCIVSNNVAWSRGGGVYGGQVLNSLVIDNICYREGGGVANATRISGSLVARNQALDTNGKEGGVFTYNVTCSLENSTFADNWHENASGVSSVVASAATNIVVWGNTKGTTKTVVGFGFSSNVGSAFHSCYPNAVEGDGNGNIASDPKLRERDGKEYVATALACRGAGVVLDWMTDATSPLYYDWYGDARNKDGRVDMGWAVNKFHGFLLILK